MLSWPPCSLAHAVSASATARARVATRASVAASRAPQVLRRGAVVPQPVGAHEQPAVGRRRRRRPSSAVPSGLSAPSQRVIACACGWLSASARDSPSAIISAAHESSRGQLRRRAGVREPVGAAVADPADRGGRPGGRVGHGAVDSAATNVHDGGFAPRPAGATAGRGRVRGLGRPGQQLLGGSAAGSSAGAGEDVARRRGRRPGSPGRTAAPTTPRRRRRGRRTSPARAGPRARPRPRCARAGCPGRTPPRPSRPAARRSGRGVAGPACRTASSSRRRRSSPPHDAHVARTGRGRASRRRRRPPAAVAGAGRRVLSSIGAASRVVGLLLDRGRTGQLGAAALAEPLAGPRRRPARRAGDDGGCGRVRGRGRDRRLRGRRLGVAHRSVHGRTRLAWSTSRIRSSPSSVICASSTVGRLEAVAQVAARSRSGRRSAASRPARR